MIISKEVDYKDGVYIELRPDRLTQNNIKSFCKKLQKLYPDLKLNKKEFHITIIFSKKPFKGKIEFPWSTSRGKPKKWRLFGTKEEFLVLELDFKKAVDLHKFLMKKYNFVFDYDQYTPHITFSYKNDVIKNKDLKELILPNFDFSFDKAEIQALDLKWDKNA